MVPFTPHWAMPPPHTQLLTLWLEFGQDWLGAADRGRSDGLHAFLCHVADRFDVRVVLFGGGIGCGDHVVGGADQGQVGHPVCYVLGERRQ